MSKIEALLIVAFEDKLGLAGDHLDFRKFWLTLDLARREKMAYYPQSVRFGQIDFRSPLEMIRGPEVPFQPRNRSVYC